MPDDLDDFEIRTAEQKQQRTEAFSDSPPPRRQGLLRSVLLALLAIVVLVAVTVFVLKFQPWKSRRTVAASPAPVLKAPSPSAEARGLSPSLDDSDDTIRGLVARLSPSPEWARWLAQSGLVRTATAIVSNIADGETPRPHLAFLAPKQRFRVRGGAGRRVVADPASFAGYDSFADTIASIDVRAGVSAYRTAEPLFDAAYRELGHPEGFRSAVVRATDALLAVPLPPRDAELVPRAVGFAWADPRLESLSAAQKQFLRIGPRNVGLVQGKLRELRAALAGGA